ncbi:hypothetical protein HYC85_024627 [Camellia sinensis]|uniref:Uncharacterized protein n=1 Tax=Camellia sinensis TaxID=4442 RepID=A0A7J7GB22_CAMSI|nr:hypothetical protein HYC85_024627 [Camellia sinensis]
MFVCCVWGAQNAYIPSEPHIHSQSSPDTWLCYPICQHEPCQSPPNLNCLSSQLEPGSRAALCVAAPCRAPYPSTSLAKSKGDRARRHLGKAQPEVNNAGISGITIDDMLRSDATSVTDVTNQSYEGSDACLRTNYYGAKQVTEELIPLLQLSNSTRIVNVSSTLGQLKFISNEKAKKELNDIDGLTLEKVDDVIERFLEDIKEDLLETKGWPIRLSAYKVSKAALNAYTISPGHIKTDINQNTGTLTVEHGAKWPVRLALLPHGGPSGLFYDQMEVSTF